MCNKEESLLPSLGNVGFFQIVVGLLVCNLAFVVPIFDTTFALFGLLFITIGIVVVIGASAGELIRYMRKKK
jgi:hypothetical protein